MTSEKLLFSRVAATQRTDRQGSLQVQRGSDYATLIKTVRAAGLLERRPVSYAVRGVLTLGSYAAICLAIVWVGNSWLQLINAAIFGLAWGQLAFLGHDAGHQAIFARRRHNDALGRIWATCWSG